MQLKVASTASERTHVGVIASDHLPVGHLVAEAVRRLVGIHRHVQHVGGLHRQEGVAQLGAESPRDTLGESGRVIQRFRFASVSENPPVFDLFLLGGIFIRSLLCSSSGGSFVSQAAGLWL